MGPELDYARSDSPGDSVPAMDFLAQQRAAGMSGQVVFTRDFGKTWRPGNA